MDAAGVDVAVLSLTAPGVEQLEPALGDEAGARGQRRAGRGHRQVPDRFMGYAALSPTVEDAVKELERCVNELGFKGWKTHCNYGDSYIDEKQYWPILAKCAELDVPIYLHPTVPMIKEFWTYGLALAGPGFGFGVETSLAMFRLVLSGVFDAYPNLKVVLGPLWGGATVPSRPHRLRRQLRPCGGRSGAFVALKRKPSEYLRDNMWVSTSCNYLPGAFTCSWNDLGKEHVVFGSDYPYGKMDECLAFLEGRGLSEAEKEMLYEKNAAALGVALRACGTTGRRRMKRLKPTACVCWTAARSPSMATRLLEPGPAGISASRSTQRAHRPR